MKPISLLVLALSLTAAGQVPRLRVYKVLLLES